MRVVRGALLLAAIAVIPACGGNSQQTTTTDNAKQITSIEAVNNTATFTSAAHGYSVGDKVLISNLSQVTSDAMGLIPNPNGQAWTIATATTDTFTLTGVTSSQTFEHVLSFPDMATISPQ